MLLLLAGRFVVLAMLLAAAALVAWAVVTGRD